MLGEDQIAQQLADARESLRQTREAVGDNQVDPVTAEAADGRVKVTISTDGRVEGFELDPQVLREGSEVIAEELRRAVNTALDERAEAMQSAEQAPDLEAIDESVAEVQDRSLRQFQAMGASIAEVMSKLNRRD